MIQITDYGFLYGIVADKPTLPNGWKYIEGEGEWLLAQNPNGALYYVTKDTLYRRRNKKNGRAYVDHKKSIPL